MGGRGGGGGGGTGPPQVPRGDATDPFQICSAHFYHIASIVYHFPRRCHSRYINILEVTTARKVLPRANVNHAWKKLTFEIKLIKV